MTRTIAAPGHPLRVVTFNILLGGARRHDTISAVLRRLDADVVALQEASDAEFVARLASDLGMTHHLGPPSDGGGLNVALLSRLPLRRIHNHQHRGRMLRSHLEAEVVLAGTRPAALRVHVVHLAARFVERNKGEVRRLRELGAVLAGIGDGHRLPNLLLGDFNALAPGDHLAATAFFARMAELRRAGVLVRQPNGAVGPGPATSIDAAAAAWLQAGIDPSIGGGVPDLPAVFGLTRMLPRSRAIDRLLGRFIERWTIERLRETGWVDCYRRLHPRAHGYTCATWLPAARIDYMFADERLTPHLRRCEVVGGRGWPDPAARHASDHFPLVGEFAL